MDLAYCIISGLPTKIRKQNWKQLVALYFDQLKTTLALLGRELGVSSEAFFQDFKAKIPIGYWNNIIMLLVFPAMENVDMLKPYTAKRSDSDSEANVADCLFTAIDNWTRENPEQCKDLAAEIVELWQEFEEMQATPFTEIPFK